MFLQQAAILAATEATMRTLMVAMGTCATLALGGFGCSHSTDKALAGHPQYRYDTASAAGDPGRAAEQQRKADEERAKANAPLP